MVNSSGCDSEADKSNWTWEENKQFEDGLVEFPGGCPNRWERISARLGTKSAAEVEQHFAVLLDDVAAIEAGLIDLPEYSGKDGFRSSEPQKNPKIEKKQTGVLQRKAARPWTEDEHSMTFHFMLPLHVIQVISTWTGKIWERRLEEHSRYMVLTRSPAQVASHAQKYYERLEKEEPNKKRRSIFDNSIAESSSLTSKLSC
ncbi:hypothetical protein DH2020_008740 [Rehmannia glutinosa]|uniref:Myb-like domain-containing protein n=1 Tax=Rehmannia glutinosa TaxID=99300 RepID=A0ABR0X4A0_REHGL